MICIGTGAMVFDEKRMRYSPDLYFKSPDEMRALFTEVPEAITNTLRVAEKCDVKIDFTTSKYPAYHPPEGKTREQLPARTLPRGACGIGTAKRAGRIAALVHAAHGIRTQRAGKSRVHELFPDRLGFHRVRALEGYPRRTWPWVGRRFAGRVHPRHHRSRPAPVSG